MAVKSEPKLSLPVGVVGRYDVARLIRELETLDDYFTESRLRKKSTKDVPYSQQIQALAADNKIDLTDAGSRQVLKTRLKELKHMAPQVHISFASEPDSNVTERVVLWFRREIDPSVLIQIGIQPSIAAGCVVRTQNHYYDFSLRNHLLKNTQLLLDKLRNLR